jgi:predicted dehydrogenase
LDLALWLLEPAQAILERTHVDSGEIEHAAELQVRLDDVLFELAVSWNAPLPDTRIQFEMDGDAGHVRWENVDGSFFRFRTSVGDDVVLDRETTLRQETLRAFVVALHSGTAPQIDTRVYGLLDAAYGRQ